MSCDENLKIGIATVGKNGLDDKVSKVFGRANTFTIVEIKDGEVINIKILNNPVLSYKHGAGPIIAKMLIDEGVDIVIAGEIGPGVTSILQQHNVKIIKSKSGAKVNKVLSELLKDKRQ